MRFANQNILVTGGTGGIGRAICRAYAAEGGRVMVADLAEAPAAAFADELGGGAASCALDVTHDAAWTAAMNAIEAQFGRIDILVNNAGFYAPNIAFEDMTIDVWRRHFAVNADGAFLGCKHAILRMKASGGGAIVNIGSGMSITANPDGAAYCGSKAAMLMTTRTAAKSAGKYNIRVNAVLPGAVDTPMLMGNLHKDGDPAAYLALMAGYSPMNRLATAQDIAHGVLMMSDPASHAITGVFLPVDCGNMPGA
ncbi:SDR family oxidoreductase [Sphingomonas sp. PL-96]|uniref:SDR family NAD(P)-dependent oxidoreductase n=1 Tax=Sphingomonas sp. PL-96 TaxID=2887201 RepID=UPI001E2EB828|nr:SDR family NAD(P)-dependent oxidoreductase [Sphingomonas sp. PL-96]MCC2976534.1 SDR family oxidoreductase [Sphingomonas sp. PL-96]